MKKLFTIICVAIATMAGFSSCNTDDENEARVLAGEWEGDWRMWYEDTHGNRWNAAMTRIRFNHEHRTSGTGLQVDYYPHGPYQYLYYKFDWEVRDGIIYLTYRHDHDLDSRIYDYTLSNTTFDGYFGSSRTFFSMDKIRDFHYWTPKLWVDSYYGYTEYVYGSKEYEGALDSTEFEGAAGSKAYNAGELPQIVKRGSYLNE